MTYFARKEEISQATPAAGLHDLARGVERRLRYAHEARSLQLRLGRQHRGDQDAEELSHRELLRREVRELPENLPRRGFATKGQEKEKNLRRTFAHSNS